MKLALLIAVAVLFLTVTAEARNKTYQTQCWTRAGVKTCNHYCWP
jgi:hypothetical protein